MVTTKTAELKRRWELAAPAPEAFFERFSGYPRPVAQLLHNRGITTRAAAQDFLNPDYATDLHDPGTLTGMDAAVRTIREAIVAKERIVVHGDYDADGLTAAALLTDVLGRLGSSVKAFVPSRYEEGYGVASATLERLHQEGAGLVITVDCGISDAEAIAEARERGLKVVVTDHHQPPERLPEAEAVVNPKLPGDGYPNKELTGVGVAFKLAQALLAESPLSPKRREAAEKWLLDLVAIGTVADVAAVLGENRTLVRYGLTVLAQRRRPGLAALLDTAGVVPERLNAGTLGFTVAPRLNAGGRLSHARDALELLMTDDAARARQLASELERLNQERRDMTTAAVAEAHGSIGELSDAHRMVIVEGSWKSGVAGLVAGRLCRSTGRPALVLSRDGDRLVGSARSIKCFNIVEALTVHREYLERFGGHAQAAGLTIRADRYEAFRDTLLRFAADTLTMEDIRPVLAIEGEVRPDELMPELVGSLAALEPHGVGNPRPLLLLRSLQLTGANTVGADGTHLKLRLRLPDGRSIEAMAFGAGDRLSELADTDAVDLAGYPVLNRFNGRSSLEWRIEDFRGA
ncbi:MAG: single-stranded-DNA-specific exonuclease RecJ [bacterium]|nr:single-stranded-DNA-specific exonuclease RecJ [bacterium]